MLKAIEAQSGIASATSRWLRSFKEGAVAIGTLSGRDVWWHESLGIWGSFRLQGDNSTHQWNGFGQVPNSFRKNLVVEINPPYRGKNTNVQGVVATDSNQKSWILHQGRMSIPKRRITQLDFAQSTALKPDLVRFSDGSLRPYYRVACLDSPAAQVQADMAYFLAECAKARFAGSQIVNKDSVASILAAIAAAQDWEHGFNPEATGDYEIPATESRRGGRFHATVANALSMELKRRGVLHSNDRFAQFGPDLFTGGERTLLFEIKTDCAPPYIYEGIGQLSIYNWILCKHFGKERFRQVLVIPNNLQPMLAPPLADLSIDLLTFERSGKSVIFNKQQLDLLLGK